MLTEYFEINEIFLRFFVLTRRNFPTIFRQLSDEWFKIKSSTIVTRTSSLQDYNLLLYHCATLTLGSFTYFQYFFPCQYSVYLSTVLTSVNIVLFFVSTVVTFVNTVLKFLNNLWGKEPSRNRVVVLARQATKTGGISSLDSILGLFKSLKFGLCVYCNIHRSIY